MPCKEPPPVILILERNYGKLREIPSNFNFRKKLWEIKGNSKRVMIYSFRKKLWEIKGNY